MVAVALDVAIVAPEAPEIVTPKDSEYSSIASAATRTMRTVEVEPLAIVALVPLGTAVKSAGDVADDALVRQVNVTALGAFAESWTAKATMAWPPVPSVSVAS